MKTPQATTGISGSIDYIDPNLSNAEIEGLIMLVRDGLMKYEWIQDNYKKVDVSRNKDFQKRFNGFYVIQRKSIDWYQVYYSMLEESKTKNMTFRDVLFEIYERTGNVEASFSSKLVATNDPHKAVIDSVVFSNLGLTLPRYGEKNRLDKVCEAYETLNHVMQDLLKKSWVVHLINQFRKIYPNSLLTEMKILDLALWQLRRR
jgi:hypothetical protein